MQKNALNRRAWMAQTAAMSAGLPMLAAAPPRSDSAHVDILRQPDSVRAFTESESIELQRDGHRYVAQGVVVEADVHGSALPVTIASESPLLRVHLRWRGSVPEHWRILNDQWERSYGDLAWQGMSGDRVLPWYFVAFDGARTHGYGVATQAACFAFWQVDPSGISLWLDVRNGGSAVHLGQRTLDAVTVHTQTGREGENAFQSTRRFCRTLCHNPRLAASPVYGGNNWYYAYGHDCSAGAIERDADLMAELAPHGTNRPFMVIDDGWSVNATAGPWDSNSRFPDMAGLASSIKRRGVRPGIWIRPLCTMAKMPDAAILRRERTGKQSLDPTVPEVMELVRTDMQRLSGWGYELIKHDFSSYDLLGRWGSTMGAALTEKGWHFADRSKTSAEVALDLYRTIREAAGDAIVIGCNTFGHLGAGLFEAQRTGDDTSGREFDRTRRMGVNTLAFRAPQQGTFFAVDADCAAITPDVPWDLSSRWLDLVARSGTALFVSPDPKAMTAETKQAIRKAFAAAATAREIAEPLDWMEITTPAKWRIDGQTVAYNWFAHEGANPFAS